MGFVQVLGPCYVCKVPFTFSPTRVPSLRVEGHLVPVCQSCIDRVNPRRIASGLPPIVPLPGAYDADDETDLVLEDWDE